MKEERGDGGRAVSREGRERWLNVLCPSPNMQPYLEAIDIQDGDGQRVLLRGHQGVDPGNEPAEEQRIQHLGDGVPGAEMVLGQVGRCGGGVQASGG